jgi:hypothetical protein
MGVDVHRRSSMCAVRKRLYSRTLCFGLFIKQLISVCSFCFHLVNFRTSFPWRFLHQPFFQFSILGQQPPFTSVMQCQRGLICTAVVMSTPRLDAEKLYLILHYLNFWSGTIMHRRCFSFWHLLLPRTA